MKKPGEKTNLNSTSTSEQLPKVTEDKNEYQKPDKATLKAHLSSLQYQVTQLEGTETPYQNEYWDNKQEGIYVDIVSGEPLYSSLDKYDSKTGWPSFTQALEPNNLVTVTDNLLGYARVEVRSKYADSHLGHIFEDGPEDKGGLRHCINSAALEFIPKEELLSKGYDQYVSLFE